MRVTGEKQNAGENLSQCYFVHQKSLFGWPVIKLRCSVFELHELWNFSHALNFMNLGISHMPYTDCNYMGCGERCLTH